MSSIVALYDIHGNLPALDAALADADVFGYDVIVIGGDVGTGYMPAETIDRLMTLGSRARFVMGNADRELIAVFEGAEPPPGIIGELAAWCSQRITAVQCDFLRTFEQSVALGDVLFCHGSPRNDEEYLTPLTPDSVLEDALRDVDASLIVGGHTHIRMDRTVNDKRFVNPGSVGMPYGDTGAFWLALDGDVKFRKSLYDLEATAGWIRNTGGPAAAEFAEENILTTASALAAAEAFEAAAGRTS